MNQIDKQKFRSLCLHKYEIEQAVEEAIRRDQEDKDKKQEDKNNAERQQKLVTFLKSHLSDEGIEVENLGVKDATYQDGRFVLTVGSREDDFPIIAEVICERCGKILSQNQVEDFEQIYAVMSLANQMECPNCDDDEEDDCESSSTI